MSTTSYSEFPPIYNHHPHPRRTPSSPNTATLPPSSSPSGNHNVGRMRRTSRSSTKSAYLLGPSGTNEIKNKRQQQQQQSSSHYRRRPLTSTSPPSPAPTVATAAMDPQNYTNSIPIPITHNNNNNTTTRQHRFQQPSLLPPTNASTITTTSSSSPTTTATTSTSSSPPSISYFTWLVFLNEKWVPFDPPNQLKLEQTLTLGGTFVDVSDSHFPNVKRVRVFPRNNYLSYLGVKYRLSRIMQPDAWLDHVNLEREARENKVADNWNPDDL